ncbi:hypothetical protein DQ04_22981000, partial [Trypanosoma grayi]|uniref:hypothetical protein n=1 Tax=Trypanosoma grayi TaxID=71804 RepID=UPI0004F4BCEA
LLGHDAHHTAVTANNVSRSSGACTHTGLTLLSAFFVSFNLSTAAAAVRDLMSVVLLTPVLVEVGPDALCVASVPLPFSQADFLSPDRLALKSVTVRVPFADESFLICAPSKPPFVVSTL